jgi:hypothetical protein
VTKNEQKVPKWFKGEVYDEGIIVENRLSGEEFELNALELSIYDMTMGAVMVSEMSGALSNNEITNCIQKGLSWFRKNNPEAYMALLD